MHLEQRFSRRAANLDHLRQQRFFPALFFFFFFLKLNSCHFVATTVARNFNAVAANEIIESMF